MPARHWPSLYDSYTSEFQQRCPREEFDQGGVDAAIELGDDLQLLRFNRLESLMIEGSSAQAVIVGEIAGLGEYQIQAAFQKADGDWKLAPAPDTQGCQAFLSGYGTEISAVSYPPQTSEIDVALTHPTADSTLPSAARAPRKRARP